LCREEEAVRVDRVLVFASIQVYYDIIQPWEWGRERIAGQDRLLLMAVMRQRPRKAILLHAEFNGKGTVFTVNRFEPFGGLVVFINKNEVVINEFVAFGVAGGKLSGMFLNSVKQALLIQPRKNANREPGDRLSVFVNSECLWIKICDRGVVVHQLREALRDAPRRGLRENTQELREWVEGRPELKGELSVGLNILGDVTSKGRVVERVEPSPRHTTLVIILEHPAQPFNVFEAHEGDDRGVSASDTKAVDVILFVPVEVPLLFLLFIGRVTLLRCVSGWLSLIRRRLRK
jgi:hypothetical protein